MNEALERLASFARFELKQSDDAWIVEIHGRSSERERAVAGTLCNFALGLTVERRGDAR